MKASMKMKALFRWYRADVNEGVDEDEGIVQMVQSSPRAST